MNDNQPHSERVQVMLNDDELAAVDQWRSTRNMPDRPDAIRELVRLGLLRDGIDIAAGGFARLSPTPLKDHHDT